MKKMLFASAVALATISTSAMAAWNVEDDGTGFVGKGDVQLVYGWNNKGLQDNAESVQFRVNSTVVTEVTWDCDKEGNPFQERSRTTTTSTQGVLASVARERNQITGFNLTGFSGTPTLGTPVTDGPQLNSCPNGWILTREAGEPVTLPGSGGGLEVSTNGTNWLPL